MAAGRLDRGTIHCPAADYQGWYALSRGGMAALTHRAMATNLHGLRHVG